MLIHDMGNTLQVFPGSAYKEFKPMLMGCSISKDKKYFMAENNLVNRIVLGLDPFGYLDREYPEVCSVEWYDSRLENYQIKDISKGSSLGNFLNLNKMGFGKTVETVLTLKALGVRDAVIVAPKQVCPQWFEHFQTWWPEIVEDVGLFDLEKSIVILNYEKLLKVQNLNLLRNHRHDAVVFDEVHMLKNRSSKRTVAAKQIPAKYHIGLTGTPILKQPDDLWSILNAIDWHYSGTSYWNFVKYFCNIVDGYFGREIQGVTKNASRLAILQHILELVTIRNDTIQVAQGKKCIEVTLPMDPPQKTLYKKVKKLVLDELPENCTIANGAVHALRLQQVTSWPRLFESKNCGVKFSWISNFCKSTDEQIVIFTKFAITANALKNFLADEGIQSVLYIGMQSTKENQQNKEKFMQGKVQVFIGTIAAAGTGLDGLQCARLGIMIERDWSPEINAQCEDRLHRRGQQLPVMWYYLQCEKTYDMHVGKINIDKAESIRTILERDD